MNFNSLAFLIFLPVVLCGYWILPFRFRWVLLLAASCYFYMYWNPKLIVLIFTTTLVSWLCALAVERWPKWKKPFLIITLVICLGILAYFKYANFFLENLYQMLAAFGFTGERPILNVLLPVGISFYPFQTLSYVIDVYRGDFPAEKHFGYYALFVSYFPQLVAGPIENPGTLLPQLRTEQHRNPEDLRAGLRLLICGFFRKCAIADFLGIYVTRIFDQAENASALAVFIGGALFCFQMYCDFAGYSEIAAGSARLMGIRLTKNFNQPYLSQSYGEFFRRWHISLNRWFTSYVYIPLGGNRKGIVRKILNTLIVFGLCGLWHGARWTYVLWGLYAAVFVCLESLLAKPAGKAVSALHIDLESPTVILLRRCYMFCIFVPAAILFRADTVGQAGLMIQQLFTGWGAGTATFAEAISLAGIDFAGLIRLLLTLAFLPILAKWGQYDLPPAKNNREAASRAASAAVAIILIALAWLSLLATEDASAFAYFQF